MAGKNPSDLGVSLGHAIFAFAEPHPGYEVAFNRWYERDHLVHVGSCAPWTISSARWAATKPLKALRYPDENPICQPLERGSYLAGLWIQQGRLEDQQVWVAEQMKVLAENDRNFEHRDVLTTCSYDLVGLSERDDDGIPPEMALDRRFPGLVLTWVEREAGIEIERLAETLVAECLDDFATGSPIALSLLFTPLPKASWWPKAAPDVPGVGERIVIASFLDEAPAAAWRPRLAGLGAALEKTGRCRTLLVAPFIPVVPGTDGFAEEL